MKSHHSILGIVTVNEKGQVVIPADVRATLEIQAGDKLLAMVHPSREGFLLIKPDGLESFAKQLLEQANDAKDSIREEADRVE
jgi:AbrB family looped-hinge helix DNA binding protein